MEREIEMLEHAGTWETIPHPKGKNVVGSKWVFRLKRKADGSIDKYKARLVGHGFTHNLWGQLFQHILTHREAS